MVGIAILDNFHFETDRNDCDQLLRINHCDSADVCLISLFLFGQLRTAVELLAKFRDVFLLLVNNCYV